MIYHLFKFLGVFLFAFTSYQSVQAGATNFTAKSVRLGDNLISILRKNGFSQTEREKVIAADSGLRHLFLTLDTKYLVSKNGSNIEIQIFDSQTAAAYKIQKKGKAVKAMRFDPGYRIALQRVEGKIHGSLMGSIMAKVPSNWVATRFMDAYAFETKTGSKLKAGANYWFTVEKKYVGPHFVKYGEILNTSLEIGAQKVQKKFVRYKNAGVFIDQEDLLESKPLYAPVDYIRIASHFQPHRLHPITKRRQPHLGVDFEGPVGTPIFAPRKGVVVRYGHNRAAGNYIVLLHSNGMETSYNHLRKLDEKIRQGTRVHAGEKIGEIGCTGYCTRAHLHFALKQRGRMIDPLKLIKAYPYHLEAIIEERIAKN